MAPMCPEEVDVFTVPHSRMKELVNKYLEMLTLTNFTNVLHMTTLLENLYKTFYEFLAHERIENKFIMKKLKDKLRALQIQNTAVCNCHNDSQLTYILNILEDGYKCTKKSDADRINYGLMLRRTLKQFTETFLPHMAEEEEVFQPLLMQYFTFEELKQIKATVLQQHFRVEPEDDGGEEFLKDKSSDNQKSKSEDECASSDLDGSVNDLSDEIVLNIFSNLHPQDLCRCARVSVGWNRLALDGSLWTGLYPVNWAKAMLGQCKVGYLITDCNWGCREAVYEEDEQDDAMAKLDKLYDEDADIDESEPTDAWDAEAHEIQRQSSMLIDICRYLVPRVGGSVKFCDFAYSKGLTNGTLYKILSLCPNLEYLDLTQTRISDLGFKGMQKSCGKKLRHVDLTGCLYITDVMLQRLSAAMGQLPCHMTLEDQLPECVYSSVIDGAGNGNNNLVLEPVGVYDTVAAMDDTVGPDGHQYNNLANGDDIIKLKCQELRHNGSHRPVRPMSNAYKICACHNNNNTENSKPGIEVIRCEATRKLSSCCGAVSDNNVYTCHDRTTSQVSREKRFNTNNTVTDQPDTASDRIPETIIIQLDQVCDNLEWKFHKSNSVRPAIEGRRSTRTCVDALSKVHERQGTRTNDTSVNALDPRVDANEVYHDHFDKIETISTTHSNLGSRTIWDDPYAYYKSVDEQMLCWNKNDQIKTVNDLNANENINSAEVTFRNAMDSTLAQIQSMIMSSDLEKVAAETVDIAEEDDDREVSVTYAGNADRCLEYLGLSGCYQVTDEGLRSLVENGGLPRLDFLDLSGCLNVTGAGISHLVATCTRLDADNLYYCDNIVDGPNPDSASGCRNLQCTTRICCRTGE